MICFSSLVVRNNRIIIYLAIAFVVLIYLFFVLRQSISIRVAKNSNKNENNEKEKEGNETIRGMTMILLTSFCFKEFQVDEWADVRICYSRIVDH